MNDQPVYTGDSLVLRHFERLSAIPRGSGHEKAISYYVADFARQRNCEVLQDDRHNLIIRKPAAPGYESSPPVIFQGHLDMVCEKNKGTEHDFDRDPIRFRLEGDLLYAQGTTLGGDNGIAVAAAMAIIDTSDMAHPELEILLTTEEETSMGGAFHLDASPLAGRMMINFDSDREGILFVSSAGGINTYHSVPIVWRAVEPSEGEPFTISVQGLKGGHSGDDIIHERGNANKLLGRALDELRRHATFALAGVTGGAKVNAIPREAEAGIYLDAANLTIAEARIAELNAILQGEFQVSDSGVSVTLTPGIDESAHVASAGRVFAEETKALVIRLLALIPSGVLSMDKAIPNLVRTSSNLGVVATSEEEVVMQSLARSSHRSQVYDVLRIMSTLAETAGCQFRQDDYFPGWPYRADSKLRPVCESAYERRFGQPIEIRAIHAGLECGVLIEKMPDLDAVSFGPNLYGIHTPEEHLSISSVERTWDYLQDVLRELKG
ncbi:aminoacyl-histidine dipeptidase [Paenibacillus methanolicus]|uniref:Cytosol non-specific dipeptidase n=1 Tax=Paenibacillus methanolicus TaxID=582686 RepID=A0A5S5CJC0_9BACL|nr:aminoacyl-histidine dipeptidase [Paenibacillus methanolicus]TYP79113.1 dipeptidase D [Paenibacillus methanolicus]